MHAQTVLGTCRRRAELGDVRVLEVDYPGGLHQPAHSHARASVTVVLRGEIEEAGARGWAVAAPMTVLVKPAGALHADRFRGAGARTIAIDIGPASARAWGLAGPNPEARMYADAPALCAAVLSLRSAMDGPDAALGAAGAALEAALQRVRASPGGARSDDRLDALRHRLSLGDAPAVAALARAVGMHPVALARAFRRRFGVSPASYAKGARSLRAASAIAATDRSLARIACECGFADQSHMTRAVRAALGITPARLRSLALQ
jgi:AraC family transcriptional regulator